MKTKKITALLLSITIALGIVACKKDEADTTQPTQTTVIETTIETTEEIIPETTAAPTEPEDPLIDPNNPNLLNPVTGIQDMDPENEGRRAVSVVVNNCYAAIPQRGISQADAIYEYETEGGQTRLLALFADVNTIPEIGSIRSARVLSSDLAATNNSIFIHYGRNNRVPDHVWLYSIDHIDGNICSAGQYNSQNYEDGYVPLSQGLFFWRDSVWYSKRATEHTAVTDGRHLAEAIEYRQDIEGAGESPRLFNFVADNSVDIANGEDCMQINVYFSATNDDALFTFDPETKLYSKQQYGIDQIDETNGEQIKFTNVLVLFARIEMNEDKYTIDAYLEDGGTGYYVSDGKIVNIKWSKPTPNDLITITNMNDEEVEVNRGKTYICVVDNDKMDKTTYSATLPEN